MGRAVPAVVERRHVGRILGGERDDRRRATALVPDVRHRHDRWREPASHRLDDALAVGAGAAGGAVAALLICYALCRLALDRRRLAAWESAWSLTGPRWTTRR